MTGNSAITGTMNIGNTATGGSWSIKAREPGLERAQRNARDDPRDDRLEMAPQPCFDQEDDGEQDQQRAEQAAHGWNLR